MSNLVFPSLPGIISGISREVLWDVHVEASRGREFRSSWSPGPTYRYRLPHEYLRVDVAEFQQLVGFHARVRGSYDSFLLQDPVDCIVAAHPFGVGDGASTAYQLQRTQVPEPFLAAAASRSYWPLLTDGYEPTTDLASLPTIYATDWQGLRTLWPTSRTNHALYSEQLDNAAWTKTGATITANASAAPTGASTMDAIVDTAVNSVHAVSQAYTYTAGSPYVLTWNVRPNSRAKCSLVMAFSSGYHQAFFDLSGAGSVTWVGSGTPATGGTASVAYLGLFGGLPVYRVTLSGTAAASGAGTFELRVCDATGAQTYLGNGSDLHAWGAQLSSVDGSYIPTTSAAVAVTDYALGHDGKITLGTPAASGTVLSWDGSYWRRVRFDGTLSTPRLVQDLWSAPSLELVSVFGGGDVTFTPPPASIIFTPADAATWVTDVDLLYE